MFKREPRPERVALVDAQGKFTGRIVTKPEAHSREERHLDVHTWVTDGRGNILMQERAAGKRDWPGLIDTAASGHVGVKRSWWFPWRLVSEKPAKAAARELFEEMGLRVSYRKLRHIGSLALEVALSDGKLHKVYGLHYLAVVTPEEMDATRLKLQTEEVERAIIYNIDQMAADLQHDYTLPESQRSFLPNPPKMWEMGLTAIRGVTATNS